jgi:transcriptional regulator with XRE-family HTH domain
MHVGRKIREVRDGLGMPRAVLARRVGVADNTIWRIEAGKRTPSMGLLEKIARELRTEPAELLREPEFAGKAEAPRGAGLTQELEERREAKISALREEFLPLRKVLEDKCLYWERLLARSHDVNREALRIFFENFRYDHHFFMFAIGSEMFALAAAMGFVEEGHAYQDLPRDVGVGFIRAELEEMSLLAPAISRLYRTLLTVAEQVGTREDVEQVRGWRREALSMGTAR